MRSVSRDGVIRLALLVAAGLAFSVPASAADRTGSVQVDGKQRSFRVHVPDSPRPHGGFPVILAFHGGGMQGASMEKLTHLDSIADRRGFIVVYPDGIDKHWNDGRSTIKNPQNDVGFVSALLDQMERDYPIDRGRIYATGISNGALFAERLGCDLSQRIAGIAPVAGSMPVDIAGQCHPARPVAVMQIDGTADPIMPYMGGSVADFGGKGEGGQVQSVAETASGWARHNGCGARQMPRPMPPAAPLDRTRGVQISYGSCSAGGPVTILAVIGGGHTWPGGPQYMPVMIVGRASRQFDAGSVMSDFFLSLPPR